MKTTTALELNYLTSILLLNYYNDKVVKKHKTTQESVESFKLKHPAYIDIPMGFMHLAIIYARELYEANLRDGLSDEDWKRLRELRNSIAHAEKIEDQQIRQLASTPEVFGILNKLNRYLYEKYNLENDETWQKYISNYYRDLDEY
ncbi:MAG: hypothetical protein M0P33_03005 [Massilibacteroides sp.]|jgi:hypothetical protein|nr:hypothetical protein [Massilibacteroides sp.]